jgi:hypothetical protein
LSAEEETSLILALQADDAVAARNLLLHHLAFVQSIARKRWNSLTTALKPKRLVEVTRQEAWEPKWRKWKPSDQTSAHWYDSERLERLAAYVSNDPDRRARDFIADFRGIARSGKQKRVLDATGLSRRPLSDLFPNDKADKAAFARLLASLKRETEPVKPDKLGIIGAAMSGKRFVVVAATTAFIVPVAVSAKGQSSSPAVASG